jgi:hypothetical protein
LQVAEIQQAGNIINSHVEAHHEGVARREEIASAERIAEKAAKAAASKPKAA